MQFLHAVKTQTVVLAFGLGLAVVVAGCERETRQLKSDLQNAKTQPGRRISALQPGPEEKAPGQPDYAGNAQALSEGKRLFSAFNCVGCHGHGGGSIGPAFIDGKWKYGSTLENIHETILEGRSEGMPAFGAKITDEQAWQLAAYVRSLSGNVPQDAATSRDDHMKANPPENSVDREPAQPDQPPH